jgi:3-oxoacyl-(acyl-carrier-protein) synthase
LLSIGESTRVIERGAADLCFSGGAESKINLMGLLRMDFAGRVAHTGDATDPLPFLRPYDDSAGGGGLLGEGGGILALEVAGTARQRGARVYAEVAGFGAAHSSPDYDDDETTDGYRFAIEAALDDAGIKPDQIDAIVPLASSVPALDRAEANAIRSVFGVRAPEIPLVTITPNVGNCMAGIGGLQAAVAAKCVAEQRLPARLHGATPTLGVQAGPAAARQAKVEYLLVCTGALGGQNAALVLRQAR